MTAINWCQLCLSGNAPGRFYECGLMAGYGMGSSEDPELGDM